MESKAAKKRKGLPRTGEVVLPATMTMLKQPNTVTFMSYDYKSIQLKALITVIEHLQFAIEASIREANSVRQLALFDQASDKVKLVIPIRNFGVPSHHYGRLKEMIVELATIPVQLDAKDPITGAECWVVKGLLTAYVPKEKYSKDITIEIEKDVAMALVNVSNGFTKFVKEIAINAQSKYTTRIYMLISSWKDKGGFSVTISVFKKWLGLSTKKYAKYSDLYRWVLRPVYEELFEKADCWFEVSDACKPGESEPYRLDFKVIKSDVYKKEKALLEHNRSTLRRGWKDYFKMSDKDIDELLARVDSTNSEAMIAKTMQIFEYLQDTKVRSPRNYAITSLRRELLTLEEERGYSEV